jgi:hypothetical protein
LLLLLLWSSVLTLARVLADAAGDAWVALETSGAAAAATVVELACWELKQELLCSSPCVAAAAAAAVAASACCMS